MSSLDFYSISERENEKTHSIEIFPDFEVQRSKDLMIRGGGFYAVWNSEAGLWSTDEYDIQRLVDEDLEKHREERKAQDVTKKFIVKYMRRDSTGLWKKFRNFAAALPDSSHQLDESLTFANTKVKKTDYISKRLPYSLEAGPTDAWEEIVSTLYKPDDRAKIEWAIGAIVSGDSRTIQKFLFFYGKAGTGKSTIINIIIKMFEDYYAVFNAKALTSSNNSFALEAFRKNPLIAVDHDGDLSRIDDNSKFNSLIAHEPMEMNEKFKSSYQSKFNAFPLMASNKPLHITDAKSGMLRRVIDVEPSNERIQPRRYQALMQQIDFELGAIAFHCLEVYRKMGKDYYETYVPVRMMLSTDPFYNFIEDHYDFFKEQEGVSLKQAYTLYKVWADEASMQYKLVQHKFREELMNYFTEFEERKIVDGVNVRSWYSGFSTKRFKIQEKEALILPLVMDQTESIFDELMEDVPAQYGSSNEIPKKAWAEITTVLSDLDTRKLHYVKVPENHIVIDFDLKGSDGQKSAELNLEAASLWPATYSEYSKGGGGIHLHYTWTGGDPTELSSIHEEGIEVKVFSGGSALRRKLSHCNNVPVADLNSGLKLKEKKKMVSDNQIKSEKGLRDLIDRALNKEIHPGTKSSIDFIEHILQESFDSGLTYDVTDLRPKIFAFANGSSNQAEKAIKITMMMKFASEEKTAGGDNDIREPGEAKEISKEIVKANEVNPVSSELVIYDVEIFPNFFGIVWKYRGSNQKVRMINPSAAQVQDLFKYKLVGFNCRKYDNHILYAAAMGYTIPQLYRLSQKIVTNVPGVLFREAYDLSWVDLYEVSTIQESLKKAEIRLGIKHVELGLPWDEPVPEELWGKVMDYCENDVDATDELLTDRWADYKARLILADISGLKVNTPTNQHSMQLVFEGNKAPQNLFNYPDLSEEFPGYTFDPFSKTEKSVYKGEVVGEGGYVYAEPGMYKNVALLDIASMHPTTIKVLELFGEEATRNFVTLMDARLAIKRGDVESAKKMYGGKLAPYLDNPEEAKALSDALKLVINSVYGLTSASFPNPFRDPRNKDNVVAKRGALFMVDLKEAVQAQGYTVAHIKTDSIKIPDADEAIINFVMEFGDNYGYTFEHEATYEKMTLVNDAVYIAKVAAGKKPAYWQATGKEFQVPYVFKKLFSREFVEFNDLRETKSATTALYLDFRDETDGTPMVLEDEELRFIGKVGSFVPVTEGGGQLYREKDGKLYYAAGAKGYSWAEADVVRDNHLDDNVDMRYYEKLANAAVDQIKKYGDYEWFVDPVEMTQVPNEAIES